MSTRPSSPTSPRTARRTLLLAAVLLAAGSLGGDKTDRVSVSSAGVAADADCDGPSVSSNGRFVSFWSPADNLVGGDDNLVDDVFLHDRKTGETTRESVSTAGDQGDGASNEAHLAPNGRYLVFRSLAGNLVAGDVNALSDVFFRDLKTGLTTLVSVSSAGVQGDGDSLNPALSPNGRFVLFVSSATNLVDADGNLANDVFLRDRKTGQTSRVSLASDGSEGDGNSYDPGVSASGRYVVFSSDATNIVADDANGFTDVFVRDRKAGTTTRVSIGPAGQEGNGRSHLPAISNNGRFVAFLSESSNFFAGDGNGTSDIFVRDRKLGTTTAASVSSAGELGNDQSFLPTISANGRYTCFKSKASNLVAGDVNLVQDVFRHDRKKGTTVIASLASDGTQGNDVSTDPDLCATGRFVAFESVATNLVAADVNGVQDVFVRDLK